MTDKTVPLLAPPAGRLGTGRSALYGVWIIQEAQLRRHWLAIVMDLPLVLLVVLSLRPERPPPPGLSVRIERTPGYRCGPAPVVESRYTRACSGIDTVVTSSRGAREILVFQSDRLALVSPGDREVRYRLERGSVWILAVFDPLIILPTLDETLTAAASARVRILHYEFMVTP